MTETLSGRKHERRVVGNTCGALLRYARCTRFT
jgi:hypothetical protein